MNKKLRQIIENAPSFIDENHARDYLFEKLVPIAPELTDEDWDELLNELIVEAKQLSKDIDKIRKNKQ